METSGSPAERMPVLFIGHGSPMNIVQSNPFTRSLAGLGRALPRPEAIMVISAHWLTRGSFVTCMDRPRMIYDFYGFPDELYRAKYDCRGAPSCAHRVTDLEDVGGAVQCDNAWGLDHAAYSILGHMFPKADIPVFEMSLDYSISDRHSKPIRYHYELGKKLRALRSMGVLVIGSGNMVHNLRMADPDLPAPPVEWAVEADASMREYLLAGDHEALMDYPTAGEWGRLAAPILDHYLPMVYAVGMQEEGEGLRFTYEGFQNGSISMRGFRIG